MRLLPLLLLAGCSIGFYPKDSTDYSEVDPPEYVDADGDGVYADADCDDSDPAIVQGKSYFVDRDGDGFGGADRQVACAPIDGSVERGGDCNDDDANVHPGAAEVCDAADIDEDCNGLADNQDPRADGLETYYVDRDGDGIGVGETTQACDPGPGYATVEGDCDDTDAQTYPGADEDCTVDIDRDCDGVILFADDDRDGFAACEDCDDTDATINPDGVEVCNGADDDCNGRPDDRAVDALTFYRDSDGDTFGDIGSTQAACTAPTGYVSDNTDCNDRNAAAFPGGHEVCDAVDADEDCDGLSDDADSDATGQITYFADRDGDSFGSPSDTIATCNLPDGYEANSDDCDDTDAAISPNGREICDLEDDDEDCDGLIDDADDSAVGFSRFYADADRDGFGRDADSDLFCDAPAGWVIAAGDCNDAAAAIHPYATESCATPVDLNCDGQAGSGDADSDGVAACLDCDDTDAALTPGNTEVCDGLDNDCDRSVDEGLSRSTWYLDGDNDGHGVPLLVELACVAPEGFAAVDDDCDDEEPLAWPGNPEVCFDGIDNDCDGLGATACRLDGDLTTSEATAAFSTPTRAANIGISLAAADTDGDGWSEIYIGAPLIAGAGGTQSGRVFQTDLGGLADLSDAATVDGSTNSILLGYSLDILEDVDGLGPMLAIGGAGSNGGVFVVEAPFSGTSTTATAYASFSPPSTSAQFGNAVAGGGDTDGDGIGDLWVGAYAETVGSLTTAGAVYLFSGPLRGAHPSSDATLHLTGASGDQLGYSVADLGDTDGDGLHDFAAGAPYADGARILDSGTVYVIEGGLPASSGTMSSFATAALTGMGYFESVGIAVTGGGDLNGDGYQDLAFGALNGTSFCGDVYVFHGPIGTGSISVSRADATILGEGFSDNFGKAITGVGDVDADGSDDLLVGAPASDSLATDGGRVYLFHGPLSGSRSAGGALLTVGGAAGSDQLGYAVASGGDLDNNGIPDLLFSAPYTDAGANNAGTVYALTELGGL